MRAAGLGDAPRTLLEEFAKIKSGDVLLKARAAPAAGTVDARTVHGGNSDARADRAPRDHAIRLRCVTAPDKPQKVLLNRLGLTLPQRLRCLDEVIQM